MLKKAGLTIDDIDVRHTLALLLASHLVVATSHDARAQLFDVNEAFAAQWLSVQKELGLPNEKSNVNGGAIGTLLCHLPHLSKSPG